MRILFDQGTPVPLRRHLPRHDVCTAAEQSWSQLSNGQLLAAADAQGFDLLVTTDQNLRYQQALRDRRIGVVVVMTTSWPRMQRRLAEILSVIEQAKPGDYFEVTV